MRRRSVDRVPGVLVTGECTGGAEQVVGDRRAQDPGELAPKRPEGRWANGPSIRSANTVSMIACWRWVMSAVDGYVGVGEERVIPPDREQSSRYRASLTRRTTSRAVIRSWVDAKAVIGDFGDLGIGDPGPGVGVTDRAGIATPGSTLVSMAAIARSTAGCGSSPTRTGRLRARQARTTVRLP